MQSADFFNRVVLSDKMKKRVSDTLNRIGSGYIAVHVRNTDLRTHYKPFFERIYPETAGKRLLVCSDDLAVIHYAKEFFSNSDVFVVSDTPDTKQQPLHLIWNGTEEQRKSCAINSIVDLLALGMSEKLYYSDVVLGFPSGYSRLANHLHENKEVIRKLVRQN